jgi:DNA-binding IclR family transcriptional regulator
VQVYLDAPDRQLLEDLARRTGLPRTEVLRRGLRRLAQSELAERKPGWSLDVLIGAMGDDPRLPADLSTRHEDYLYGGGYERLARTRGHKRAPRAR